MAQKEEKVKITQVRSSIGYNVKQRLTLEALGLRKINHSVIKNNTDQVKGMVKKVHHLVSVEEAK